MQYISSFDSKKLIEYLRPGQRIMIDYPHGLGDVLMFAPYFNRLKELFPDVEFHLNTTPDKIRLLPQWIPTCNYDYVFRLSAHFVEGRGKYTGMTKPEANCIFDLGISYDPSIEYADVFHLRERYPIPESSLLIGFSFFSTHFPGEIDCRESFGRRLWSEAEERGYIPIELQFFQSGNQHNLENRKFHFVTNTTRKCKPDVRALLGLVSVCAGVVSVATGTYHLGMTMMPNQTLFLGKDFGSQFFGRGNYIRHEINVRSDWDHVRDNVDRWFDGLKQNGG